MQLLCQTLAEQAVASTSAKFRVHVDNIMFYGDESDVQTAIKNLSDIAKKCSVTFSDIPTEPTTRVLFHGVYIDFAERSVAMSEKAIAKFERFEKFLEEKVATAQHHLIEFDINSGDCPLLKILGVATFWARTMYCSSNFLAGCMASRFAVMQLIRAVCRAQYENHTTFMMNRGALAQLRAWMKTIPRKVFLSDLTSRCTLTTDACTTGGGYVVQRQGVDTLRMAFPWRKPVRPDQMGVYELRSIAIGLTNTELENASITIVTDSTIAIGGLQNGYSPSAEVNSAIRDIYEICQKKNIRIVDVQYVNTEDNIADELSRAVKHSNYSEDLPTTWVWEQKHCHFESDEMRIVWSAGAVSCDAQRPS
jgi:hypothetical protein